MSSFFVGIRRFVNRLLSKCTLNNPVICLDNGDRLRRR